MNIIFFFVTIIYTKKNIHPHTHGKNKKIRILINVKTNDNFVYPTRGDSHNCASASLHGKYQGTQKAAGLITFSVSGLFINVLAGDLDINVLADGLVITVLANGLVIIVLADGLSITVLADGLVVTVLSDGLVITVLTDGLVLTVLADGLVITVTAGGCVCFRVSGRLDLHDVYEFDTDSVHVVHVVLRAVY